MKRENSRIPCVKCKHGITMLTCKAFPNRIPNKILTGIVKHDRVLEEQTGEYIYEPEEEFIESDKRQAAKEKKVLSLYEKYKKELPKLIFKEVSRLGYDMELLEKITFKFKMSEGGPYTVELTAIPENKRIRWHKGKVFMGSDIFAVSSVIYAAEELLKKSKYWVHLIVFNDGSYEYLTRLP